MRVIGLGWQGRVTLVKATENLLPGKCQTLYTHIHTYIHTCIAYSRASLIRTLPTSRLSGNNRTFSTAKNPVASSKKNGCENIINNKK